MVVTLHDIHTIGELFRRGALCAAEKPIYASAAGTLNKVSLYQGDITTLQTDAIVNAANPSLLGGGGVDGAIHAAAGSQLLAECRTLGGCKTGDAKITGGYNLPAKHVIHAVGPVYDAGNSEMCAKQLASCYRTSLGLAAENACETVAFPSISTGIYGYPLRDATHIALNEVRQFMDSDVEEKIKRVVFVVFKGMDRSVYEELIPLYFPPVEAA
ncbi:A1pp-domain-containing protein [Pisolithus marmoratus]|nr:A1pp-domain-containing protein [Pisolithus marmoratus]